MGPCVLSWAEPWGVASGRAAGMWNRAGPPPKCSQGKLTPEDLALAKKRNKEMEK